MSLSAEIELRPVVEADCEFAFRVKREALSPHVVVRWGWDETFQLALHRQRWTERPWFIILWRGDAIGTVCLEDSGTESRLGEFYLLPEFQRRGIGSALLGKLLVQADARGLPIRLEYLKWNPVGSLYKRHGFAVVSENETHYFLVRQPSPS